jgi:hypothetical protein
MSKGARVVSFVADCLRPRLPPTQTRSFARSSQNGCFGRKQTSRNPASAGNNVPISATHSNGSGAQDPSRRRPHLRCPTRHQIGYIGRMDRSQPSPFAGLENPLSPCRKQNAPRAWPAHFRHFRQLLNGPNRPTPAPRSGSRCGRWRCPPIPRAGPPGASGSGWFRRRPGFPLRAGAARRRPVRSR